MAHSVETRLPFLDYRLVEFLVNCAPPLKLRNGWSKWILREALKGTLPEKVRLRKTKLAFATPQMEWMRRGLRDGAKEIFATSELRMKRFLVPEIVVDECRKFTSAYYAPLLAGSLFRVLNLELWARIYSVS